MAIAKTKTTETPKLAISLLGKEYTVTCDPGQEERLQTIVEFVNQRLEQVAEKAGHSGEARLFMLTCLVLADELMETHLHMQNSALDQEDIMVAAVEHLRQRIATIANQVGDA